MKKLLEANKLILKEGAVVERLRRLEGISLHPSLVNAPLIYEEKGRIALTEIYNSYIEIAKVADIPFLMETPTWRANLERVSATNTKPRINVDAVQFMKSIREAHADFSSKIFIGGLIGCKNDCYKPEETLSTSEAESFHDWQVKQLVEGGVDFLIAETLPSIEEALGIAKCMEKTEVPYIISFVISRDGFIMDGHNLKEAIQRIDDAMENIPLGYSINCTYPTFLNAEKQDSSIFKRLIAFGANASSLDQCDLDQSEELHSDSVSDWGEEMLKLNRDFGMKILGGCCGTDVGHLKYIVNNYIPILSEVTR